ncbi:hypothetical protein D3C73_936840 [compost metagenome]
MLEELWLKLDKEPLYKGLLQVAVGLYHFRNGNVIGARKMLRSACHRLAPYSDDSLGIDLGKLRSEAAVYADALDDYSKHPISYYDLSIDVNDPELRAEIEAASERVQPIIPQRRGPQRGAKHEAAMLLKNQRSDMN